MMQRILTTALTLAVLVYALVLGVKWLSPKIEQDLAGRITTELAKEGQLWATLKVEGREVTLGGEAPSPEAKNAARAALARVFGVAKVNDLITLYGQVVSDSMVVSATELASAPALSRAEKKALAMAEGAYMLTIEKNVEALTLTGSVPDEAAKQLLLTLATTHFPEATIDARNLAVVATGAPAGWRSAAGTVLFNLVNLETASATLMGREVMVSGTVLSADFAEAAESAMRAAMPTLYQVAFAVDANAPATAPMAVPVTAPAQIVAAVPAIVSATSATVVDILASKPVAVVAEVADTMLANIEPSAGPALCANLARLETAKLRFAFNSTKVRKADGKTVRRVAETIKSCTGAKVLVKGYTDKTGSKTYNQWLSQQRAEAALRALLRQGVERKALRAKGYGETTKFGSQKSRKARAENRRVTFSALGK